MEKKSTLDLIGENSFFEEFFWDEKEELAQSLKAPIVYRPDEILLEQGAEDASLFVLLDGELKVTKNEAQNRELAVLKPGAIFGSIPSLLSQPRNTNILAKTEATVLKFEEMEFHDMDPQIMGKFKDRFIELLFQRIETLNLENSRLKEELGKFS